MGADAQVFQRLWYCFRCSSVRRCLACRRRSGILGAHPPVRRLDTSVFTICTLNSTDIHCNHHCHRSNHPLPVHPKGVFKRPRSEAEEGGFAGGYL